MMVVHLRSILGRVYDRGDLLEREIVEDPELDDEALPRRKLREAQADPLPKLFGDQLLGPKRARERDVVFERDRVVFMRTAHVTERQVHRHPVQPGAELGLTTKAVEALEDADKRALHDVLGVFFERDVAADEA